MNQWNSPSSPLDIKCCLMLIPSLFFPWHVKTLPPNYWLFHAVYLQRESEYKGELVSPVRDSRGEAGRCRMDTQDVVGAKLLDLPLNCFQVGAQLVAFKNVLHHHRFKTWRNIWTGGSEKPRVLLWGCNNADKEMCDHIIHTIQQRHFTWLHVRSKDYKWNSPALLRLYLPPCFKQHCSVWTGHTADMTLAIKVVLSPAVIMALKQDFWSIRGQRM